MRFNPTINFIPSAFQASESLISDFEARIGHKFPADYRDFLKLYNGPEMEPQDLKNENLNFAIAIDLRQTGGIADPTKENSGLKFFEISWWNGFANPSEDYRYGLVEQYDSAINDWQLPKSLIPIAGNSASAKVYLSLARNSGFGHVLLGGDTLLNRQAKKLEIRVEDFVTVAPTFSDFVASLKWIQLDDE